MSSDESYLLDDDYDNDVSDSGSSGTFAFTFCFGNCVSCFSGVGSGVFLNSSRFQLWCCCVFLVWKNKSRVHRWSTHDAIVLVWNCHTHSDFCHFTKDMIRRWPIWSIHRPSNPGSGGTKDTKFIWWVDGREPQIHKLWCLRLDSITWEVLPTSQVEVVNGTMEEFTTDYLVKDGRRILIIGQLSINGSVRFLGITDFVRGSWLYFLTNLQAIAEATGWGNGGTSNQNWGLSPGGP